MGNAPNPYDWITHRCHKDELLVEYPTCILNSQLFVQKYRSIYPTVKPRAVSWN